jgi:hypothetical protein
MRLEKDVLWVVYKRTTRGKQGKMSAMNAICEQGEWDEMELAQPGYHTLIRAGITIEADAERLARSQVTMQPAN